MAFKKLSTIHKILYSNHIHCSFQCLEVQLIHWINIGIKLEKFLDFFVAITISKYSQSRAYSFLNSTEPRIKKKTNGIYTSILIEILTFEEFIQM